MSDLWSAEEDVQKNWLIEYFVLEVALMVLTIRVMVIVLSVLFIALNSVSASEGEDDSQPDVPFSPPTKTCIGCHSNFTPGIVQDWLRSRHAQITPGEALKKSPLERRISAESLSEDLMRHAVGCYECHGLNTAGHDDSFDHMGRTINVIVTPNDCRTCHPQEAEQFSGSKKSYAHKIIMDNPVYASLVSSTTGIKKFENKKIITEEPSGETLHETCLGCHGTKVEAKELVTRSTDIGPIKVPQLTNWPNQGVGRVNPDGSTGACTACHPRHSFSIGIARKPYTCGQCHHEPDVPAWNIYEESKHGNIYFSTYHSWNFQNVPWVLGRDFQTPTCAACHNSLLVSTTGDVIAERTHDFGSRLWVRLFGLIYSVPQPKSGDTTIIKNKEGLPLPVTFTGEPASGYLIDKPEQEKRQQTVMNVCSGCHSTDWTQGHFAKLENTINETNIMTKTATDLLSEAWEQGIEDRSNPFDESIEHMWIRQWLFYSNSIRYASAMTGAPDYTTFKNGWWHLTENIQKMKDRISREYDDNEEE